jgi:serine/threonine protein kinase
VNCPACKSPVTAGDSFCGNCGRSLVAAEKAAAPDLSSLHTADSQVSPASVPQAQSLSPGAVVANRYELIALIGSTGAIDTFLARDRLVDKDVSLKVLRPDPRLGGRMREQFVMAAAAARDIRHGNIAAIYDTGEADGVVYVSTEAVEGVTLRDWNRRRLSSGSELGMSSIVSIIFAILDAIMTIHIRKLVRVDLKPANVALLSDPAQSDVSLKLVDVGLPYSDSADTATTGFGASPYRAPEALTAIGSDLSPSADVYSISMIFYELLAGVPLAGHWQAPSAGRSDVPAAIDQLIQDGLSNNPRRRPSIQIYRDALHEALGALDPKPAPSPRPRPGPGPNPAPTPTPEPGPSPDPIIVNTWKVPDFLVPILKTINMPFVLIMMTVQSFVSWIELLIFSGQGYTLGQKRAARGWITAVVSLVLVAVVGLAVWGGVTWYNNRDVTVAQLDGPPPTEAQSRDLLVTPPRELDPPPQRPVQPVTPVRASQFAAFNGYWADDFGGAWTVQVNDRGEMRGMATAGMFAGTELAGAFSGRQFQFLVGNAYGTGGGAGLFDGGCHIDYQTLDPFGSGRLINAKLHINHPAGAPCP